MLEHCFKGGEEGAGFLKGTVLQDYSCPVFFHQTTSPGPNGHAQEQF
jgi:hypothetical protein